MLGDGSVGSVGFRLLLVPSPGLFGLAGSAGVGCRYSMLGVLCGLCMGNPSVIWNYRIIYNLL